MYLFVENAGESRTIRSDRLYMRKEAARYPYQEDFQTQQASPSLDWAGSSSRVADPVLASWRHSHCSSLSHWQQQCASYYSMKAVAAF